ncbi:MAG: MFS transporter [Mycobacteriales bacterium]
MRNSPAWLTWLLAGQLVSAAGSLAWLFLTLYLVQSRGMPTSEAGLVTAGYGLASIAGNLLGGSIGDRYGIRLVLLVSKGLALSAVAAFPLMPTVLLGPVALLAGLSSGVGSPLMSALVAGGMPAGLRREAIARSRAANNAGTVLGPPLGGLLAAHHFEVVFVVDALSSLVLLVVVARWVPGGRRTRLLDGHLIRALVDDRQLRRLVLTELAVDTTYRLLYTALPLLLRDHGAPPVVYGLSVTLNALAIVCFEPRVARRLAGHPAWSVIGAGYALVGLGWLVLGAAPVVAGALTAVLVISAGEMLYKPTATALAADLAPAGMEGRYQSLYAAASIGGMLLSPLLGTTLYGAAPRLVWPAAGMLALAMAVLTPRGRTQVVGAASR